MVSRKKRRKRRTKRIVGVVMIVFGLILGLIFFDDRMRPLIKIVAESKATTICTRIINDDIAALLSDAAMDYSKIVTIQRDGEGTVTSVQTDMAILNSFKSKVTSMVQQDVADYDYGCISLPLGTIIGGDYFVGRGPLLNFHLDMSCSVLCTISNRFDDAGINQTRHQIMLNIKVVTYIIIPWYRTSTEVSTNYVLAETVIVGMVPEYFTSVQGSENVVDDLNDYGFDIN